MKNMLNQWMLRAYLALKNERGSNTVEWVFLIAAVIVMTTVLSMALGDGRVKTALTSKIAELIRN